jgi:hypothetical protein
MPNSTSTKGDWLWTVLCWAQGIYFLATGVWPLVHLESFEAVTGEKTDDWLVITVGVLVTSIGVTLLVAAYRRTQVIEIAVLAIGSAAALTGIDVYYSSAGVISKIYLADALAELLLIGGWAVALRRRIGHAS